MNNEEQKKKDQKVFEDDIKNVSKALPNHKSKEFTFSGFEQQLLAEQQTIAVLANQTQNRIINEVCLKRIGVEPNNEVHIRYSIGLGRFVVFTPKKKSGTDTKE